MEWSNRRRDGELDIEKKRHIEQPGLKDQERSNLQPVLEAPEPEGAELDDEGQEEEQDEERLDQQA